MESNTPPSNISEVDVRRERISEMRRLGLNPFAQGFKRTHNSASIVEFAKDKELAHLESIVENPTSDIALAGRVVLARGFGSIIFATLQDGMGTIQVMFSKKNCQITDAKGILQSELPNGMSAYKYAEKMIDIGDFIGVKGQPFYTKKGELTLFVKEFTPLVKAMRPLPEKWAGIANEEIMYRQRYLDLISNRESYDRFIFRSKFIKALRDFYEQEWFLEVETPILGNSASGAAAKPFQTHHNDYDTDVFLRISPETSLKTLTVGGFEKVFEIAKDFRNEGSDPSHLQEFTMVEHYAVYWGFEENMEFAEKMFKTLFEKLGLPSIIQIEDKDGVVQDVDFSKTWERIDYAQKILEVTGIDIREYTLGDEDKMRKMIAKTGVDIPDIEKLSLAVMIDYLYKKKIRPYIVGPSILFNYPKFMQPLARTSDANPNIVEQFQVLINGWEIIKSYSELVDPIDQRERFEEQSKAIALGDEEATSADYDFVHAMEYGMPCQSGLWFGIDRFLALITKQKNLRDVILFPLMKPKTENNA